MPDPEAPLVTPPPSQVQEVSVDANVVIQVLRQQISELQWQNTLLQAQLITVKAGQEGSNG